MWFTKVEIQKMSKILAVVAFALTLPMSALADGGNSGGGGFYGYHNGKWVLLDDLEEGKVITPETPETKKVFAEAEVILKHVDETLPGFGAQLRKAVNEKTWHLVPFPIRCEESQSMVEVEITPGACQDGNDVFIEESKFDAGLLVHETIQSERLRLNEAGGKLTARSVRGVKSALTANPPLNEDQMADKIARYGYGQYLTATRAAALAKEEKEADENWIKYGEKLKDVYSKSQNTCSFIESFELYRNASGIQHELSQALSAMEKAYSSKSFDGRSSTHWEAKRLLEDANAQYVACSTRLTSFVLSNPDLIKAGFAVENDARKVSDRSVSGKSGSAQQGASAGSRSTTSGSAAK